MFKQTNKSAIETIESQQVINTLGAITPEQHAEFAKLTGRFDVNFKIGKPSNMSVGK